jgi:hypothetical protein
MVTVDLSGAPRRRVGAAGVTDMDDFELREGLVAAATSVTFFEELLSGDVAAARRIAAQLERWPRLCEVRGPSLGSSADFLALRMAWLENMARQPIRRYRLIFNVTFEHASWLGEVLATANTDLVCDVFVGRDTLPHHKRLLPLLQAAARNPNPAWRVYFCLRVTNTDVAACMTWIRTAASWRTLERIVLNNAHPGIIMAYRRARERCVALTLFEAKTGPLARFLARDGDHAVMVRVVRCLLYVPPHAIF